MKESLRTLQMQETKIVGAARTTPLVFYLLYVGTDGGIKTVSSPSLPADETRRLVSH